MIFKEEVLNMKKFIVATNIVEYRVVFAESPEEAFEKNNNGNFTESWVEVSSRSAEDTETLKLTLE